MENNLPNIAEAAETLETQLRPFPWFVSAGIMNGGKANQTLMVYVAKNPKNIPLINGPFRTLQEYCQFFEKEIGIPISIERMGHPKPCHE